MTEDQFQQKCVMWFDEAYPQYRQMLFAVPNGGKRDTQTARLMKSTGVKAGVSDLILVLYMVTVFIELKVNGNTQDPDQIKFQKRVEERKHLYFLVEPDEKGTIDNFKKLIKNLIP